MDHERLIQLKRSDKVHEGIILEITSDYIHVLNSDCDHVKVEYKEGHRIGEHIVFLDENLVIAPIMKAKKSRVNTIRGIRYLSVAAAILMIIFLINTSVFNVTYAVMSLDINPSIELELNKKGQVISVLSLNKEAVKLVSKLTLKGHSYESAITKILDEAVLEGYKIDQRSLLIAVAPTQNDSEQIVEEIRNNISVYTERLGAEIIISDQQNNEHEKEEGLSLGRHLISEEHPDYDDDDIKHLEIHDLIERMENESQEHEDQEHEDQEHEDQESESKFDDESKSDKYSQGHEAEEHKDNEDHKEDD